MGQFSCSFSSFYLFSQFTITAASDQDGSFSAAELQQLKNKVTPWHNFSHGAAWLSHRSRLQSLQIGFKVATKPCFLPWYLPSKIEHMILCIIYRLSKTSLPFWFITLLTDTRDLVSPLASHILQLPIMTNSTLVWLSLASFVITLFKLESYITSYWHEFTSSEYRTLAETNPIYSLLTGIWEGLSLASLCMKCDFMLTLPKNAKPSKSVTEWRYFKDCGSWESFAFSSAFSFFFFFQILTVVLSLQSYSYGFIILRFNSPWSNICKLGEPKCFNSCFNWRRFSFLWDYNNLF